MKKSYFRFFLGLFFYNTSKKTFLLLFLPIISFSQTIQTLTICDGDSVFLANAWQTQAGTYFENTPTGSITTILTLNPLPVITPNFILNGNAQIQPGNVFQLTQAINGQSGSVWNNIMINLNQPFHFDIDVFLGCNPAGADGIAFVLQPISTSLGSSGGGMGYQGISPSFSVEFDTWRNAQFYDPVYNHIAIQKNGNLNHNGPFNLAGPVGVPPGTSSMEDCNWHNAIFIWNPSTLTFSLEFDGNNILNYTGNIVNTIFGGNPNVYWGFTGATGGANNLQKFRFNYSFSDTTICKTDTISLSSMATASSYSYLWSPNYNISNDTIASPQFYPETTTVYSLEVTNSYGCTYIDSFTLFVDTVDVVGATVTPTSCYGGNNGQATVLVGGNSSFYTFQWNDVNNQNTQTAYNLYAGQYTCIISSDNQCSDTLGITILEPQQITYTDIQQGCDSYTWIDGVTYTSSNNTATWYTTNSAGCDSIITLDLTIYNPTTSTDIQQACDTYTWIDGIIYTSSNNTATWHTINAVGCDSIITLDLTIYHSTSGTDVQQACDSYRWTDGITYTQSNTVATYTMSNGNVNGCDSIITLDLTIYNPTTSTDVQQACGYYVWINGIIYTQSNTLATYTIPNGNVNGCDSIITLDLTINNSTTGTDVQQACDSYTWIDGITYTQSNTAATYTMPNGNINGCDSIIILNLTINNSSTSSNITSCDSYNWPVNNTIYINSGLFIDTSLNVNGCTHIDSLSLTIHNSTTGTDVQYACDSYTWIDGMTYTSSNNTATWYTTNSAGCDSIITLDLTIYNSTTGIDVQQACDSYTWIDGMTYTQNNTVATYTIPNSNINGCDSIITLDLTIYHSTTSTDVQQACNSHTWIDGLTYTSSNNTAIWYTTNTIGCDSIIKLDLTIYNSTTSTDAQQACDSYTWIDGGTYIQNNTAATYIMPNSNVNGCDSIITLDLTIYNSTTSTDVQQACDSYTWIDGMTYTQSNTVATYTIPNSNMNGCDSIISLYLTILPPPEASFSYEQFNVCYPTITFTNTSNNFTNCFWDFGDNTFTDYLSPTHAYEQSDEYLVSLFVENISECVDSVSYSINPKETIFFAPNSFTPNADAINDIFKIHSDDLDSYELYIYSRWGELIFYSEDINNSWDGTFFDESCQEGIYSWRLNYYCGDEMQTQMGVLKLLR